MKIFTIIMSMISILSVHAMEAEDKLPIPKEVILASQDTLENKSQEILAARRYAAFWNTGIKRYADEALDPNFMDRTLPEGRQQGPKGPIEASKMFRAAVPDLKVEIEKMIVAHDHVVLHMNFQGHFTGVFKDLKGNSAKINFIATDIYKIKQGKITDNWHIEDNLKLFSQLGVKTD